jgi:hypothetical protein
MGALRLSCSEGWQVYIERSSRSGANFESDAARLEESVHPPNVLKILLTLWARHPSQPVCLFRNESFSAWQ